MLILASVTLAILFLANRIELYDENSCSSWCKQVEYNTTNIINCHIDRFGQADVSCLNTRTRQVNLVPNERLILDRSFMFYAYRNVSYLDILISRLEGFGVDVVLFNHVFKKLNTTRQMLNVFIYNSKFVFYDFDHEILNSSQCNDAFIDSRLSQLFDVKFKLILSRMNYQYQLVCPLLFKNSYIKYLQLNYLSYSFVEKNSLKFLKINYNSTVPFSRIDSLSLVFVYRVDLNDFLFDSNVFGLLAELSITGTLQKIEKNVFSKFKQLERITLDVYNFNEFIRYGLDWMLFVKSNAAPVDITIDMFNSEIFREYFFPDEDFCYFKDIFSNRKINFYLIGFHTKSSLSCTLIWIFKDLSVNGIEFSQIPMFRERAQECKFELKLNKCAPEYAVQNAYHLNNVFDIQFLSYQIKFITLLFILPFVSVVGIVLNLLVIIVLLDKRHNHTFHRQIYKFMTGISMFNFLILILYLFKLMSDCITYNGLFCSLVREVHLVQCLYIAEVFLIRFFKFCSSLTLISFSLSRYMDSERENKSYLIQKSRLTVTKIYIIIFVVSMMFSFENILQYKLNNNEGTFVNKYPIEKNLLNDFEDISEGFVYVILLLISEFANSFVIVVINFVLDIFLIIKIKKLKKKFFAVFSRSRSTYIDALKHKEMNLFKMVIFTGLANFFLRIPELIGSIMKYLKYFLAYKQFKYRLTDSINIFVDMCVHMDLCTEFQSMAEVIYLISFSVDFVIFYVYNKSFRLALKRLFKIKLSKKNSG